VRAAKKALQQVAAGIGAEKLASQSVGILDQEQNLLRNIDGPHAASKEKRVSASRIRAW
jgi:hypothetical protein